MNSLGRHIVVELYNCDPYVLDDVSHIEQSMLGAARSANATVIQSSFHHFSPFGVSGVVVIQESHLAIHTWPEFGYAAVDLFTCGEVVDPWVCYQYLFEHLKAGNGSAIEMGRGTKALLSRADFTPSATKPYDEATLADEKFQRNIWFTERDNDIALSLRHSGDVLYRQQSPYQKVEVYDTYAYGKMLTLDGLVMTTEKDEYVYHEMITHVPMQTHPNPKQVLVIGGGDGGAVREIVRYPGLERVVMVEIDQLVIDASKEFLPDIAAAFDHPKLELHVADGIAYVNQCADAQFDVVIIDSTDPVGPGKGLFTEEFYQNVYRILKPQGVMITQSESPRYNVQVFKEIYQFYDNLFGKENVHCYLIQVPTYPSGTWSLSYCTKGGLHPLRSLNEAAADTFSDANRLNYYNGAVHRAAFALPNFVRRYIQRG